MTGLRISLISWKWRDRLMSVKSLDLQTSHAYDFKIILQRLSEEMNIMGIQVKNAPYRGARKDSKGVS
jgi:hypothetical protein